MSGYQRAVSPGNSGSSSLAGPPVVAQSVQGGPNPQAVSPKPRSPQCKNLRVMVPPHQNNCNSPSPNPSQSMESGVVGGGGGQLYLSSQGPGMVRGGAIATPVVSVTGPNGLAISGYPPAFQGLSPSTYFSGTDPLRRLHFLLSHFVRCVRGVRCRCETCVGHSFSGGKRKELLHSWDAVAVSGRVSPGIRRSVRDVLSSLEMSWYGWLTGIELMCC